MNKKEVLRALNRGDVLTYGDGLIHQYKSNIYNTTLDPVVDSTAFSEMSLDWENFSFYCRSAEINTSLLAKFHREMTWSMMAKLFPKAFLHGMNEVFDVIDNAKRLGVLLFAPSIEPSTNPIGIYARLNHPAVTRERLEEDEDLFEEPKIMLYRLQRDSFIDSHSLSESGGSGLGNVVIHYTDKNFQHLLNMAAYIIIVTESEIGCSQFMYAPSFVVRIKD